MKSSAHTNPPKKIKVVQVQDEAVPPPLPFTSVQETVSAKPRPEQRIHIKVYPGHKPHQFGQEINHNIQLLELQLRDTQLLEEEKRLAFQLEQATASI